MHCFSGHAFLFGNTESHIIAITCSAVHKVHVQYQCEYQSMYPPTYLYLSGIILQPKTLMWNIDENYLKKSSLNWKQ